MKAYYLKGGVSILFCILLLMSCLGSGDGGTMTAGGGIGGSGVVSQGSITSYGSIVVNGTEFDTSEAMILVNGEEIGVGDLTVLDYLDIGKVVTVEGTRGEDDSHATAGRVIYNRNVKGPVEQIIDIDAGTREIQVLGQTVFINAVTVFKDTGFDAIAIDDMVEVSGYTDDTGAIWATFFEKTGQFASGVMVEVTGYVSGLDEIFQTFDINGLTVDYSSADTSGLPDATPTQDLWVEVSGELDETGTEMVATEIQPGDELEVDDADGIEVTGFVIEVTSEVDFKVGNQPVRADDETLFVDGDLEDLQPGAKLEAEGQLIDGILFAEEIEFWEPDQIEVEGYVTDVASDTEFTLDDQVVETTEDTRFEEGEPEDIEVGVKIEVKGRLVDGILLADKVSFEQD